MYHGDTEECLSDVFLQDYNRLPIYAIIVIAAHIVAMGFHYSDRGDMFLSVWEIVYFTFHSLHTLEVIIKILGLRRFFFRDGWNCLDFMLCTINSFGIVLGLLTDVQLELSFTYNFRILHFVRYLTFIEANIDIHRLVTSFVASLPALINVSILLFLLIFIYTIMGTSFFSLVKHNGAIDRNTNFENVPNSFLLLFRLSTSAGYEEILEALSISEPDCTPTTREKDGDCGDKFLAVLFLLSFILLAFIILANILVAVILDSYNDAAQDEKDVFTEKNIRHFYECWQMYDPKATQYMNLELLPDFLDNLDDSTRIAKPNALAITVMDLPIIDEDKVHCLDVLRGIFKVKIGELDTSEHFEIMKERLERDIVRIFPKLQQAEVTTTTLEMKRRDFAARVLQKNFLKLKTSNHWGFYSSSTSPDPSPDPNDVISEDSIQNFYKQWRLFDPRASQHLHMFKLPDFLDTLEGSLRIRKPNSSSITFMDIPVTSSNKVHCLNVLSGILKVKKMEHLQREIEIKVKRLFPLIKVQEAVTTTSRWKKEDDVATVM